MEKINETARLLRRKHDYRGYIHLKIIPGASDAAIEEALSLATAVSLNIETPGKGRFEALSKRKDYAEDIVRPIKLLGNLTSQGEKYSGKKCTTQFIVGASDETDSEIVDYTFGLYRRMNFKRVYFSAYQRGLGRPDIPGEKRPLSSPRDSFMREHRLYQADFLIRRYGFSKTDMTYDGGGNLRLDKDPKEVWADLHPEFYPVRLNRSDREALLKAPGIGPETAGRILRLRREGRIARLEDLGVRGKRLEKIKRYAVLD
jgi:predicted DNA-binding helix-hairpin-helix protein